MLIVTLLLLLLGLLVAPSRERNCSILQRLSFSLPRQPICSAEFQGDAKSLLIVVISYSSNFDYRQAIRSTWGENRVYPSFQTRIQTVFFVGTDDQTTFAVRNEQNLYGDVVQIEVPENDSFLVFKDLASLHWTRRFCPNVRHIFRINDLFVLNTFLLLKVVQSKGEFARADVLYGLIEQRTPVQRQNESFVSHSEFAAEFYPNYARQPSYLLSNGTCERLLAPLETVERPILRLNDVFVSGVLREWAGVQLESYSPVATKANVEDQATCDAQFEEKTNLFYCAIKLYPIRTEQMEEFFASWDVLAEKFNRSST